MDLKEYQGKKLLAKFGIPVPKGILISKNSVLKTDPFKKLKTSHLVLKAQIPFGKRGKVGGILFAQSNDFKTKIKLLFSKKINNFKVEEIWVEEKLNIKKEFYLAVALDRETKGLVLIFSSIGGVDIEETARLHPDKIIKIYLAKQKPASKIPQNVLPLAKKLIEVCKKENALLLEINPLILTNDDGLIAADAKITIDDNSLKKSNGDLGFSYVELSGNIGVIGNGAGLVMSTLDVLGHFGGQAANFLDIGGGANKEKMFRAIDHVLSKKKVKGLFINIFGGITRCDQIAQGIVDYHQDKKITIPLVVRLVGTNEKKGQQILKKAGINFIQQMDKAVQKIIKLAKDL